MDPDTLFKIYQEIVSPVLPQSAIYADRQKVGAREGQRIVWATVERAEAVPPFPRERRECIPTHTKTSEEGFQEECSFREGEPARRGNWHLFPQLNFWQADACSSNLSWKRENWREMSWQKAGVVTEQPVVRMYMCDAGGPAGGG